MAPSPSVLRKALMSIANVRPASDLKVKAVVAIVAVAKVDKAVAAARNELIKWAIGTDTG